MNNQNHQQNPLKESILQTFGRFWEQNYNILNRSLGGNRTNSETMPTSGPASQDPPTRTNSPSNSR